MDLSKDYNFKLRNYQIKLFLVHNIPPLNVSLIDKWMREDLSSFSLILNYFFRSMSLLPFILLNKTPFEFTLNKSWSFLGPSWYAKNG